MTARALILPSSGCRRGVQALEPRRGDRLRGAFRTDGGLSADAGGGAGGRGGVAGRDRRSRAAAGRAGLAGRSRAGSGDGGGAADAEAAAAGRAARSSSRCRRSRRPAEVTLPLPKPKAVEKKPEENPDTQKTETTPVQQNPPAPRTTAAPRSEQHTAATPQAPSPGSAASRAAIASWRDLVLARLQQNKRYPSRRGGAPRAGRGDAELQRGSQRPRAGAQHRAQLRLCGARRGGAGDDPARPAVAGVSARDDAAIRSIWSVPIRFSLR